MRNERKNETEAVSEVLTEEKYKIREKEEREKEEREREGEKIVLRCSFAIQIFQRRSLFFTSKRER